MLRGIEKYFKLLIVLIFIFPSTAFAQENKNSISIPVNLTKQEKAWLANHQELRIAPDPDFPPVEWIDENGKFQGLAADFVALVEKQIGIQFKIVKLHNWNEVISKAKTQQIDILSAASPSAQRKEYLLFTKPHIVLPGLIFVKDDIKGSMKISDLRGKKVTVVSQYVWQDYITKDFPEITLFPAPSVAAGLRMLSFGSVDAMVGDLATTTYYLQKEGITNLHVAGETGYYTYLSFASRKDWPQLNTILEKALDNINPENSKSVLDKWINLKTKTIFDNKIFWNFFITLIGIMILLLGGVFVWNRSLQKLAKKKTQELSNELAERMIAVEALKESEEKFRVIFEQAAVGVSLCDSVTNQYIKINRKYCDIVGYDKQELRKVDFKEITHPDDLKEDLVNMDLLLEGKIREFIMEKRYRKKDQSTVWVRLSVAPIWKKGEKPNYHIGIIEDITAQKMIEQELRKSESRLKAILEANPDPTVVYDKNGYLLFLNPSFTKTFGWSFDEIKFKRIPFVPEDQEEITALKIKEIYASGKTVRFETKRLSKTGEIKDILLSAAIIKIEQEGHTGLVVNLKDITKRKKNEVRYMQTQKMETIGTLAGGIAHDFNNILFPVLGHTEMLLQDIPEDSSTHDSLKKIYSGAKRARDLVKQILTFSRQENGELRLIKMQPIIKEALKLLRSTIPTTIDIKQDIDADCGLITADPTQIHQIIMNLTTNAFHAMEKTGGELKVSLKEVELNEYDLISPNLVPGDFVCMTIADTGKGIDKDLIKKIFDPFFTTKELGKGTGMGLSVVHGIVKKMNGDIKVYSEPGKGAEFKVYFPVEKSSLEKPETKVRESIQGGTEQILLVDDENAILTMGKQMLERLGYQVTSRTSSIEALETFRDSPDKFDLVITDMAMPNMSGDKLSAELVKIHPDISVLICTGFSETISADKAASLGIKGFFLKPIVMSDLARKIREVLEENKN